MKHENRNSSDILSAGNFSEVPKIRSQIGTNNLIVHLPDADPVAGVVGPATDTELIFIYYICVCLEHICLTLKTREIISYSLIKCSVVRNFDIALSHE